MEVVNPANLEFQNLSTDLTTGQPAPAFRKSKIKAYFVK